VGIIYTAVRKSLSASPFDLRRTLTSEWDPFGEP